MSSSVKHGRVLYVTDDRSEYLAGGYYLAFQNAFDRLFELELTHPLEDLYQLKNETFGLVVLGSLPVAESAFIDKN